MPFLVRANRNRAWHLAINVSERHDGFMFYHTQCGRNMQKDPRKPAGTRVRELQSIPDLPPVDKQCIRCQPMIAHVRETLVDKEPDREPLGEPPAIAGATDPNLGLLTINEKYTILFDKTQNDRPLEILRYGQRWLDWENAEVGGRGTNALHAMYYALLAERSKGE